MSEGDDSARCFKTGWFAKAARKAKIADEELCEAIREVMQGQAVDLGGGVFKKRLNKNMHRCLVLARGGPYWIYAYLFAKSARANIKAAELADFRALADSYAAMTEAQVAALLKTRDLVEICDADDQDENEDDDVQE